MEKHKQPCETSRALAVLASASSVSTEREEFMRLVNKEIELYNNMLEKEVQVDAILQNLEKEIDDADAKIGDRWRLLDRDHDGKVTPEEVAAAAMYLKDTSGKEGVQELISNLSKDGGSRAEEGISAEAGQR
ncbi:hypothetical protein Vadar_021151 [Vaccinium darrowii]|uniref:Uncharacterized protein n=1 Tax=Vaccinium darrowii TaxID=229202 RepID=A0ACB7YXF2_9ERIC|nr:hypothetical protein Vadar_021151 [Vaccinium darrowii]